MFSLIVLIIAAFLMAISFWLDYDRQRERWNDGVHEFCGGKWEQNKEFSKGHIKYYSCCKCHKMLSIHYSSIVEK